MSVGMPPACAHVCTCLFVHACGHLCMFVHMWACVCMTPHMADREGRDHWHCVRASVLSCSSPADQSSHVAGGASSILGHAGSEDTSVPWSEMCFELSCPVNSVGAHHLLGPVLWSFLLESSPDLVLVLCWSGRLSCGHQWLLLLRGVDTWDLA